AVGCYSAEDELLNALVGEAEQLTGIAQTDAELVYESSYRALCLALSRLALALGPLARASCPLHRGAGRSRESNPLLDGCGFCVVDPQTERFPNATTRLIERASIGMAAPNFSDADDPGAGLITLEDSRVLAQRSHFLPRHGSRSRSIARSVPGGRSRLECTGTVVSHLAQRTRT